MPEKRIRLTRLLIFFAVAGLHLIFIFFFVITLDAAMTVPEQPVAVMKLTDLAEEEPPPLPPPPPPPPPPEEPRENVVETIAENMIETEEVPPEQILAPPATITTPPVQTAPEQEDYLPMHLISNPPVFSERDILRALVYPTIPLRSGIEGMVYLELFIDREGLVKRITILKEEPQGRGFGEAAVKAFEGIRCIPAEANGQAVAVRYRYPVRFRIRG
ncbi:MAG: TonB family protein [Spirochaetaceae bacterium]|jgi:protein TonB|nr:TonB family protein [Spirochaetaceae bacterium]